MLVKRQTELFHEWLENYIDYERMAKKGAFSLDTMQYLVERFHHPEKAFKSVHVAGSKGKGSVTTMIASILDAHGFHSGVYTSPHLIDFAERITSSSGPFTDILYGKACDILVPLVESIIPGSIPGGMEPSWFELVTLFAFVTFKEARLPWAVVETGLGGRLDATNVLIPEASVLTPIELEHTEYLGNTIAKIASEKAGIIKNGIPVFSSEQQEDARNVFIEKARETNSPFFCMEDAIFAIEAQCSIEGLDTRIEFNQLPGGARFDRPIKTRLSMVNMIQAHNAALAAYTVKYLFPDCSVETIERGLSRAWLPGRFEIVRREPAIIMDGAHTVRSMTLTLETFSNLFPGKAHLLFACAADKAVDQIAELFKERFTTITVTRPGEVKQSDIAHASKAFTEVFGGLNDPSLTINADYEDAIISAVSKATAAKIPLLITGSFYLVSEAKRIFERLYPDLKN